MGEISIFRSFLQLTSCKGREPRLQVIEVRERLNFLFPFLFLCNLRSLEREVEVQNEGKTNKTQKPLPGTKGIRVWHPSASLWCPSGRPESWCYSSRFLAPLCQALKFRIRDETRETIGFIECCQELNGGGQRKEGAFAELKHVMTELREKHAKLLYGVVGEFVCNVLVNGIANRVRMHCILLKWIGSVASKLERRPPEGMKTIAMECGERSDCEQLKDPKMLNDLYEFKRCLSQTILVNKKQFCSRLSDAGFDKEDILLRSQSENLDETCGSSKSCCEPLLTPSDEDESHCPTEGFDNYDEEEQITSATQNIIVPTVYGVSVDEVLNKFKELELEARDNIPSIRAKEKEVKNNDVTEEINKVVHSEESAGTVTTPKNLDRHLFPPGRIMHIVSAAPSYENSDSNENDLDEKQVYLYETPIQLYGKLRLSRRMIFDHMMRKYMKVLEQLINQLENSEAPIYMMGDDDS
ncbi:hypothetical protein Fmac_002866 [Flemingia macrophylla]|uniref:Uncharacterized protein n=1 Tax=Flemingia macrophylla TaxID=520843 RepID=A0ABD1NL48_9FABA